MKSDHFLQLEGFPAPLHPLHFSAVAQWKADICLHSKILSYYRPTIAATAGTAEICSLYIVVSFL